MSEPAMIDFPFIDGLKNAMLAGWSTVTNVSHYAGRGPISNNRHPGESTLDAWRPSAVLLRLIRGNGGPKVEAQTRIVVAMGQSQTAGGNEMLETAGLTDCCAVGFLTDFDEKTGHYRQRTLMHLPGGDVTSDLDDTSGQRTPADKVMRDLFASRQGERHKLVIGFGVLHSSEYARSAFLAREPIAECARMCGDDVVLQHSRQDFGVLPNGTLAP